MHPMIMMMMKMCGDVDGRMMIMMKMCGDVDDENPMYSISRNFTSYRSVRFESPSGHYDDNDRGDDDDDRRLIDGIWLCHACKELQWYLRGVW